MTRSPRDLSLSDAVALWRSFVGVAPPLTQGPNDGNARAVRLSDIQEMLVAVLGHLPPAFEDQRTALLAAIRIDLYAHDPTIDPARLDAVLDAMAQVPREQFVHAEVRDFAYLPAAFDIGHGQTISDPAIVAAMTLAAFPSPGANALDVGTGSGYQAAILSRLAGRVTTIEIVEPLATQAIDRFRRLGYPDIEVKVGDGFSGFPEYAPYDVITVAAAATDFPQPLVEQLKPGGRIVMPIGPTPAEDVLTLGIKTPSGHLDRVALRPVQFVPLTGRGAR
ncbi:MAG TPA: protein-L-isoaspartate(D-aspartate) O-methyltransferase [Sphingomonas sp.]